ncbi:DUF2235 domain-containing protein [uncultured Ferrimonas sp.]|uniref:phospholipase effector Tle1 domain-containing protein n=1 Tax=uncultured Ferrimonas sp. TaxID=432640 RepID=UPI002632AA30|nr:DUF2235 domain-containing protein [uncultured Ferrimonas sp.]
MKKIVLCADGEWDGRSGLHQQSNVARLARYLAPNDDNDHVQLSYFEPAKAGVPNQARLERDLLQAYRFIIQNYQAGDLLYCFGFSYGAFLMRLLTGLIDVCGVLQKHHLAQAERALALYWQLRMDSNDPAAVQFRSHFAVNEQAEVRLVGLFDCVGEHGVPARYLGNLDDYSVYDNATVPSCVRTGRHALALDETRGDYVQACWDELDGVNLQQVWFSGDHQQLGGLEIEHDGQGLLGDLPLAWMVNQATEAGLEFDAGIYAELNPNPLASIPQARSTFVNYFGRGRRRLQPNHYLHESVQTRCEQLSYQADGLEEFIETVGWQIAVN